MKRLLAALVGIALVAGLLWIVLRQPRPTAEVGAQPSAGATSEGSAMAPAVDLEAPVPPVEEMPERAQVVPAESAAAETSAAKEGALVATIRGRFLLPGGEPAAGVSLDVHGWAGSHERKLKYGAPSEWVDPQGVSEPDGTFALARRACPAA